MAEPTIVCPQCKSEIKLTDSLAAPLIKSAREEFEQRLAKQNAEIAGREGKVREQQEALERATETLNQRLADALRQERPKIALEESKKARMALAADFDQQKTEVVSLQKSLAENNAKLAEAQKAQAELIRKQRELDDAKREMELTIEKRIAASLGGEREKAQKDAEERLGLKVAEKEQTIAAMQKQIEDLKRRAEQGSQQLQGEVLELRLESILREQFPRDVIEPVAKGVHGGDVLQRVNSDAGRAAGAILWESKRTKTWSDGWLAKLRDDQRAAKAELAVIVSQALPKDVQHFSRVENVWVVDLACVVPVAVALRHAMIELAAARQSADGQQTKMALVYQYLTGPAFRHRVEAIVEQFTEMREDLDKERKVMTKLWAKREQQLTTVLESTAGLYGDLQGIAGKGVPEIEGLDVKMLDAPSAS